MNKKELKDGYYLSVYLCVHEIGNLYHIFHNRHDYNVSLWKKSGQDIKLVHYWELERQSRIKHNELPFYRATHQDYYMNKVKKAISNKLPVICTEFSGCEANGNGNINKSSLYKWLNYLKSNGIGYCCWSLSNKNESASLLKSNCLKKYGYKKSDLSKMGKLLVEFYKK